jgi:hypothetical protein
VAKVTANGAIVWATYLGGTDSESAWGIAVDTAGNALVAGNTFSMDFDAANNSNQGSNDAYVARVSSNGSLAWATYLGGNGEDCAVHIALDSSGNVLVAGDTYSSDFPGANNASHGGCDAFVAKLAGLGDVGDPPASITPGNGTWIRPNPLDTFSDDRCSISTGALYDVYAFMPDVTGSYSISTGGALDSQLRIYDSSGAAITPIMNANVGGESTTQNFTAGNWYYIAVGGYQSQTGSYTLSISGPPLPATSISTSGPSYTGTASDSINYGGNLDYFQITAPSGTTSLNLSVVPAAGLDTLVQLYDSSGAWLQTINNGGPGGTDSASTIPITAGATYYIGVSGTDASQMGGYAVYVGLNPPAAMGFPLTVITSWDCSSQYATSLNAFSPQNTPAQDLRGQGTWYAYGRVIELADQGYLDSSALALMQNAFMGITSGRDAKYWPSFLAGTWTATDVNPLPVAQRLPGQLVVWSGGPYGHVGFVEEVSADKSQYRLSDFNRDGNQTYLSAWYPFEGTSDQWQGTYPSFYQLPLVGSPALPAAPTLRSPGITNAPGQVLSTTQPTFQWQTVLGADQYDLHIREVSADGTPGALVFDSNAQGITIDGSTISYVLPSGYLQMGDYYRWSMRSHSSAGWGTVYAPALYFNCSVTCTWTGGGGDDNWTTDANWSGGAAPQASDDLVFPAVAAQTTNSYNNVPDKLICGSLTFMGGGYIISGNPIALDGGITNSIPAGQTNELALNVQLASATTQIVANGGALTFSGTLSGGGTVVVTGTGTLNITGPQHWAAGTVIQIGSADATPFGDGSNQVLTAGLNDAVSLASATLPASGTTGVASSRLAALARLRARTQPPVSSQAVTAQEVPTLQGPVTPTASAMADVATPPSSASEEQPLAAPTTPATVDAVLSNGLGTSDALLTDGNQTSTSVTLGASSVAEDESATMLVAAATSDAQPPTALPADVLISETGEMGNKPAIQGDVPGAAQASDNAAISASNTRCQMNSDQPSNTPVGSFVFGNSSDYLQSTVVMPSTGSTNTFIPTGQNVVAAAVRFSDGTAQLANIGGMVQHIANSVGAVSIHGTGLVLTEQQQPNSSALQAASPVLAAAPVITNLTQNALQPIVQAAIARWAAAGATVQTLSTMQDAPVVVADLAGSYLGRSSGSTLTTDQNTAGYDWLVDSTPNQDQECVAQPGTAELQAVDPRAVGHMDLLTVVQHELGHTAGLDDLDPSVTSLMSGQLGTGIRRSVTPADVDAVFSSAGTHEWL